MDRTKREEREKELVRERLAREQQAVAEKNQREVSI